MMALFGLMSALPLKAQVVNGVNFKSSFPFYAGEAKMPAGSYKTTQSDIDPTTLLKSNPGQRYRI
jgi:hypothetical protein